MRAILINPFNRTVTETETDGTIFDMHERLTVPGRHTVEYLDHHTLAPRPMQEFGWLDDEGLLKSDIPILYIGEDPTPLAGCVLVLGCDEVGDNVSSQLGLEQVRAAVKWTNKLTTGKLADTTQIVRNGFTEFHVGAPILKDA